MIEKALSGAIRALRLGMGQTQQEFANVLGVAVSSVARYEAGYRPSGKLLDSIRELAIQNGFPGLAIAFHFHLYGERRIVLNGYPDEYLCIQIAQRISRNAQRRAEFFKFAERERLAVENEWRRLSEDVEPLYREADAFEKRMKSKGKRTK